MFQYLKQFCQQNKDYLFLTCTWWRYGCTTEELNLGDYYSETEERASKRARKLAQCKTLTVQIPVYKTEEEELLEEYEEYEAWMAYERPVEGFC